MNGATAYRTSNRSRPRRERTPRVTIGVPVYNGMPFLVDALDSVLAQTFDDFEVVIVDNGSTDDTEYVCREYAARDPRIRYERSPVNRGAAYSWNRVRELARGEFFKWVADDDLCDPELLVRSVTVMDRQPNTVLVYPRSRFIDAGGRQLSVFDPDGLLAQWPNDPVARGRHMIDALFDGDHGLDLICTVGIFGLMRTRCVGRLGGHSGADWTLVLDLALRGEVAQLAESLSAIRRHDAALSWQNFQEGVTRAEFAVAQQQFHDPSRQGRLAVEIGLWRKYWEMAIVIVRAPLRPTARARLLGHYAGVCAARVTRRLGPLLRRARSDRGAAEWAKAGSDAGKDSSSRDE